MCPEKHLTSSPDITPVQTDYVTHIPKVVVAVPESLNLRFFLLFSYYYYIYNVVVFFIIIICC